MEVIVPNQISDANLTSNVPDTDYAEWTAGTYNQGDTVKVGREAYEVVASSTTDNPLDGIVAVPATWIRLGYINKWRMFEDGRDSKTTRQDNITVTLDNIGLVTAIGILGIQAEQITVTMTDPVEGIVFDETRILSDIGVFDWWEYFFTDYSVIEDVVFDLPPYPSASITITVENTVSGSDVGVGRIVAGDIKTLGMTLYGTSARTINYSRKTRDGFGNVIFIPRRFTRLLEYNVAMESNLTSTVYKLLQNVGQGPALYIGSRDPYYENSIVFGFQNDFRENFTSHSLTNMTLEIEGY